MDFHNQKPSSNGYEDSFDKAAKGFADSVLVGLSRGAAEVLADPIVQALLEADGVDRASVAALLRRMAAKLADRGTFVQRRCSW